MKNFARGLSSVLLKLTLFNLAIASAMVLVFGTPDLLKKSIADSRLYDTIVSNVIKSSEEATKQEGFPIYEPEIQEAIKDAFPPKTLKKHSENVIDSIYKWLNGDTPKPNYVIDLTPSKQKLAEGVGDYAYRRYQSLPACTATQLRALSPQIDPFTVPCKVPGVDPIQARRDIVTRLATSEEFLKDPVITVKDLPKDAAGKTVFDNLSFLPTVNKIFRNAPVILGIFSVLLMIALALLYDTRYNGLRTIGGTFAGTGLFVLIATLLLGFAFKQVNKPGGALNRTVPGSLQDSIVSIAASLYGEVNKNLLIFGIVYIVIGAIILLALRLTFRRVSAVKVDGNVVKPAESVTVPANPSTPEKPTQNTPNNSNTVEPTKK
jgi:hypothetical protein